jgi:hypothetical protein
MSESISRFPYARRPVLTRGFLRLAVFPLGVALCIASAAKTTVLASDQGRGASLPWITYEAEDMQIAGGEVLGPHPATPSRTAGVRNTVEMEASGGRCVKLRAAGSSVQFSASADANALVIRYCLPDSEDGRGLDSTLTVLINGREATRLKVTSRYSWRYGGYTFSNKPSDGNPRNFFDEVRCKGLEIRMHDAIRIEKSADDAAAYCIIDLVDLEKIPAPLPPPPDALSVIASGAKGDATADDTIAFQACIDAARSQGKAVWIPAGDYLIAGDLNNIRDLTIQGAGMWHTTLVGDPARYNLGPSKQIRFNGGGDAIHIRDFSIIGRLDHRNDGDANDGFGESFGSGSSIERVWVEHTKTGAWIANSSGLLIAGCRFRNTIADGVNLCVGVRNAIIADCTARGCGDDCFAVWPAAYAAQTFEPGRNVIRNCTGQLSSLGNGAAIYGGEGNAIQDCVFTDMPYGCGILISGTFPIGKNRFSATTVAQRCDIIRCGGFDSGWNAWRAAVTICPHHQSIAGVDLNHLTIAKSLSYALEVVSPGSDGNIGVLSAAHADAITVDGFALGVAAASSSPIIDGVYGVWAGADAMGSLSFSRLTIDGKAITSDAGAGSAIRNDSSTAQGKPRFTFSFGDAVRSALAQP